MYDIFLISTDVDLCIAQSIDMPAVRITTRSTYTTMIKGVLLTMSKECMSQKPDMERLDLDEDCLLNSNFKYISH